MGKVTLLGASALQSAVFVGALIVAQPAMAQATTTPPPPVATEGQQENEEALAAEDAQNPTATSDPVARETDGSDTQNTVTVTGSRIRIPNLESIEPTTTVDYRQVRERNFTNVADALNELPNIRGSVTPAGAQGSFGQGTNFVNTYGLGSNRTLTLINGRRFVTSNPATNFGNAAAGTQTDLNVFPTSCSTASTSSASAARRSTVRTRSRASSTSSCVPSSRVSKSPASRASPRKATTSATTSRRLPAVISSTVASTSPPRSRATRSPASSTTAAASFATISAASPIRPKRRRWPRASRASPTMTAASTPASVSTTRRLTVIPASSSRVTSVSRSSPRAACSPRPTSPATPPTA